MNTRQGILVTCTASTLFLNFASIYWTMWSVLSMAFFVITLTDFMFFEVRIGAREQKNAWARAPALSPRPSPPACTVSAQDDEFWP